MKGCPTAAVTVRLCLPGRGKLSFADVRQWWCQLRDWLCFYALQLAIDHVADAIRRIISYEIAPMRVRILRTCSESRFHWKLACVSLPNYAILSEYACGSNAARFSLSRDVTPCTENWERIQFGKMFRLSLQIKAPQRWARKLHTERKYRQSDDSQQYTDSHNNSENHATSVPASMSTGLSVQQQQTSVTPRSSVSILTFSDQAQCFGYVWIVLTATPSVSLFRVMYGNESICNAKEI